MSTLPGSSHDLVLRFIEPGTPEYAEAAEIRFDALYADLGLSRDLIADTDGRTYLHLAAFRDARMVGYARLWLEDGESKIFQVSVARDAQRSGVGAALVRELVEIARAGGRDSVVLDARAHVVGFYERLGFSICGEEFLSPRTHTPHFPMCLEFGLKPALEGHLP